MEEATELEFLLWFYQNADFGPADGDVHIMLEEAFESKTKKKVPKNLTWRDPDEDEEEEITNFN